MALINCPACGKECSSQAYSCPHCGQPLNHTDPPPKNWLLESILATILCCLPFGVVGIVYASKVENLWYSGRKGEAMAAAKNARTWTLVSFFVSVGWWLIYILLVMLGVMANFFTAGFGH